MAETKLSPTRSTSGSFSSQPCSSQARRLRLTASMSATVYRFVMSFLISDCERLRSQMRTSSIQPTKYWSGSKSGSDCPAMEERPWFIVPHG